MKTKPFLKLGLAVLLASCRLAAAEPAILITQAHAHNDYEHPHPLRDALDHCFCSVEADIYLVDGQLLVAHARSQVKPKRTLQALYLDPLRERVEQNGGRVFRNGPEFTLLIDLKQNWRVLYPALRDVLEHYTGMLTTFQHGLEHTKAVLVIITGDRDKTMFAGETTRLAAYDGELSDLQANPPTSLVPWISASWGSRFYWRGTGQIPEVELVQLKAIVRQAHMQGRRVRFWGAPDNPTFWRTIHNAGVDLINTDNLASVENFFETNRSNVSPKATSSRSPIGKPQK